MKLENTGKSLSDLASLLTERSSSGKEKENEAEKADFDPLHPFKAKKKRCEKPKKKNGRLWNDNKS